MKVLFVSSGNSANFNIVPFIKSQGESLRDLGIDITYFPIIGEGLLGYYKGGKKLKKYLKENPVDIIHAHYALCGWSCVFSNTKIPIVLSLMGSDAYGEYIGVNKISFKSRYLTLLVYLIQPFVSRLISKSSNIEKYVYRKKISRIIPNGVNHEQFQDVPEGYREELGFQKDIKYILFLGDKNNKRKNFTLVSKAVELINDDNIELLAPYPISHDSIAKYLNSVDILVLSAFMEGSPNIIKEAMSCNCPIVSTDVGDVKWIIGDTKGCYIASFDYKDFAAKIDEALYFGKKTQGRKRILELGIDSKTIATKIINVYKEVIEQNNNK